MCTPLLIILLCKKSLDQQSQDDCLDVEFDFDMFVKAVVVSSRSREMKIQNQH